ncbi:MAG: hypothetical protein MR536_04180 [Prevotella sp.]|nr:hypothetical protein [Prevotella sp.]MDD7461810.1 hypothetical protein [Prevotellaceae bacterium]MDY3364881.1 hypothetical protein [Prevotella sp.]MDY3851553.1 hypothetical protein [Prevotella sp.]
MKRKTFLLCLLAACLLMGCRQDNETYFSTARIVVQGGDTITIERIQATATLTNINTGQVVSSTDFQGNRLSIDVLRGAYHVSIQGLVRYSNRQNKVYTRPFRAYAEYASLANEGENTFSTNLFFMN